MNRPRGMPPSSKSIDGNDPPGEVLPQLEHEHVMCPFMMLMETLRHEVGHDVPLSSQQPFDPTSESEVHASAVPANPSNRPRALSLAIPLQRCALPVDVGAGQRCLSLCSLRVQPYPGYCNVKSAARRAGARACIQTCMHDGRRGLHAWLQLHVQLTKFTLKYLKVL